MVKWTALIVPSCLVAAFALTAVANGAAAQDTQDAQDTQQEEARKLFQEGLGLAEVDRWAEALSAFRRSAALVSRPSTSYNIANALYRLDRPVEALAELDEYDQMAEVRDSESAQERGRALRTLLESTVGEVHLTVTPETAAVFVDGRPSVLTGPERHLMLNPGEHSIRVTHEGYESDRREIRVERGSRETHRVQLQPQAVPAVSEPVLSLSPSSIAVSGSQNGLPGPAPIEDDRDDRERRFVKSPGFWVMMGVIAAAGIGAGVAIAVTRNNDGPSCGTTGDCATTEGLTLRSF